MSICEAVPASINCLDRIQHQHSTSSLSVHRTTGNKSTPSWCNYTSEQDNQSKKSPVSVCRSSFKCKMYCQWTWSEGKCLSLRSVMISSHGQLVTTICSQVQLCTHSRENWGSLRCFQPSHLCPLVGPAAPAFFVTTTRGHYSEMCKKPAHGGPSVSGTVVWQQCAPTKNTIITEIYSADLIGITSDM